MVRVHVLGHRGAPGWPYTVVVVVAVVDVLVIEVSVLVVLAFVVSDADVSEDWQRHTFESEHAAPLPGFMMRPVDQPAWP